MTTEVAKVKQRVAQQVVADFIEDHRQNQSRVLGIGSGSTVNAALVELAATSNTLNGLQLICASKASENLAQDLGLNLCSVDHALERGIGWYLDGADQVELTTGYMLKGLGNALTREKLLASCSQRVVCMVDATKPVQSLGGQTPIVIEVVPWSVEIVTAQLQQRFGTGNIELLYANNRPLLSDNGCYILHLQCSSGFDALAIESELQAIAGVVCCGIFAKNACHQTYLGSGETVEVFSV